MQFSFPIFSNVLMKLGKRNSYLQIFVPSILKHLNHIEPKVTMFKQFSYFSIKLGKCSEESGTKNIDVQNH